MQIWLTVISSLTMDVDAVVDGQPALEVGSLEDIRGATKGGMDPSGAPAGTVTGQRGARVS